MACIKRERWCRWFVFKRPRCDIKEGCEQAFTGTHTQFQTNDHYLAAINPVDEFTLSGSHAAKSECSSVESLADFCGVAWHHNYSFRAEDRREQVSPMRKSLT